MTDSLEYSARAQFQQQVADLLETRPDANILDLAARLDMSIVPGEDNRCAPNYQTEAVVRALFAKEIAGWSNPELERRLANNLSTATALGFDEDIPEQSSFWEYWNSGYFSEDLKESIQRRAKWTRNVALEENHSIGDSARTPEDERGDSQRTESRLIRENLKTVPKELVSLIADEWNYLPSRHKNLRYHRNAFIELECLMAVQNIAAEDGSDIFGDHTNRSSGAPDGDTHLHYIKQCTRAGILRRTHTSTGLMVNRAKSYLEFDRPVDVAIDYTDVPYYGKDRDNKWVWDRRGYDKKDHDWAHRYATISIVGDNIRFVLGMLPYPVGKTHEAMVDELVKMAQLHVNIDTVYADKAFATTGVVRVLTEQSLDYIIPAPRNSRVKREIDRMRHEVKVKSNYGFFGKERDGGAMQRAETNLVLLPSTRSDKNIASFYTNKDVDDSTSFHRNQTERRVNKYERRWGTETNFRSLKIFLPKTASNNHVVRIFHFAFGVLLFNLWRLIDLLVQQSMDAYETRSKPRVTAKRTVNAIKNTRLLN